MTAKIKTHPRKSKNGRHHRPKGVSDHAFKKVYWPYIPVVLVISTLLIMTAQSGALATAIQKRSGSVLAYATSMSKSGLLSSTNAARSQKGVAALKTNSKLTAAAQAKANDMANRNYWSHNTPEGNPPWVFVTAQGYKYQKLGENLAAGFSDEQSTVNGWMASSPHKANLLDSAFTEVGFGYANNANYTSAGGGPMTIVVAMYGRPQVLAAQTTQPPTPPPPPATTKRTSPSPVPTPPPEPTPPPPPPTPEPEPEVQEEPLAPPNTEAGAIKPELAASSSRAQLVLASLPFATVATSIAAIGFLAALGIWISRHALAVRRAIIYGERFAIRHPLLDLGLLIIAALAYLLTQTAGFIQ